MKIIYFEDIINNPYVKEKWANVVAFVEATSNERLKLWSEWERQIS